MSLSSSLGVIVVVLLLLWFRPLGVVVVVSVQQLSVAHALPVSPCTSVISSPLKRFFNSTTLLFNPVPLVPNVVVVALLLLSILIQLSSSFVFTASGV